MHELLMKLVLTNDEASIVEILFKEGELTVSKISELAEVNRTNCYRILEDLCKRGFVLKNPKAKTTKYSAPNIDFFQSKVADLKAEFEATSNLFSTTLPLLKQIENSRSSQIQVIHYAGASEVKQLLWNSLSSNDIVRSFGYRSLREAVGIKFLVKWWNESMLRGQKSRMIANLDTYKKKDVPAEGRSQFLTTMDENKLLKKKYIEEDVLKIINETFVYDDIYAIIEWHQDTVFGVEIQNQSIANQQKYLFDLLWEQARDY